MVQTIERCDRILRIAAQTEEGMKLTDAVEQTGLKYTTVYNLVASLVQCGMLEKGNGVYRPGSALGELNALRREHLYLEHVRGEIICLSRFSKPHSFVYSVPRGTQIHALLWKEIADAEPRRVLQFLPPLNSVAGLVMLAFLPPREAEKMLNAHIEDSFFKNEWNGSMEKLPVWRRSAKRVFRSFRSKLRGHCGLQFRFLETASFSARSRGRAVRPLSVNGKRCFRICFPFGTFKRKTIRLKQNFRRKRKE